MTKSQKFATPTPNSGGNTRRFTFVEPQRWTPARKLAVIDAITWRKITKAKAIERHSLAVEELNSWLDHYDRFGLSGLKATKRFRVES